MKSSVAIAPAPNEGSSNSNKKQSKGGGSSSGRNAPKSPRRNNNNQQMQSSQTNGILSTIAMVPDNSNDAVAAATVTPTEQNSAFLLIQKDEWLQRVAAKAVSAILPASASTGVGVLLTGQPVVTLTIYIPTAAIGAVIGRRGQNIAQIQRFAALAASAAAAINAGGSSSNMNLSQIVNCSLTVRVSIVGHQESSEQVPYTYSELDWSDADYTPVVIRAEPVAALVAATKLEDIAKMQSHSVDEVVLDIPVSRNKHAVLVGKRGMTLANLSADHNVRIMVPNKELRHDMVQLEGDLANVKQCLAGLLQIVGGSSSPTATKIPKVGLNSNVNSSSTNSNSPKTPDESMTAKSVMGSNVTVTVTANLTVPQLPSQTKLRTVTRKCEVNVKKKRQDDAWVLSVHGTSQEQVQQAVALLQKWSEEQLQNKQQQPQPPRSTNESAGGSIHSTGNSSGAGTPNNNNKSEQEPKQQQRRNNNNRGRGGRNNNNNNNKGTPKRTGAGGKQNNNSNSNAKPSSANAPESPAT